MTIDRIRNIGISAHIDSGKTTLSERILFFTGRIHKITDVKDASGAGATMDFMPLEIEKGITIRSAATFATWKGHTIHLVDTPGHVDFTIEVERALRVLDGAVLVLCGVAGVQSQSYTVDRQMRRYRIPRIAFVNKLDRAGADPLRVVDQLRDALGLRPLAMQIPIGLEARFEGVVDLLSERALYFDGEHGEIVREAPIPDALVAEAAAARARLVEAVAEIDDDVATRFVRDEPIAVDALVAAIRRATLALRAVPVFMGSAYANKGVQPVLDGVVAYLPAPTDVSPVAHDVDGREVVLRADPQAPFVGLAFKVDQQRFGQLTYVRVYQGRVAKGDFVHIRGRRAKVPRVVRMHADAMVEVASAAAGDLVAWFGVECESGDTFTDGVALTMPPMHVPDPVISLAVAPRERERQADFAKALARFAKEDPTFRVHRDAESSETVVSGMGELHIEIYVERMRREHACDVVVGPPRVKYRETITRRATFDTLHRKQDGGHGQYARVAGYIEPLGPDAGAEFVDATAGGVIPREFLGSCDRGFREAIARGTLIAAPIVGVRFVVEDGTVHPKDSSDPAFRTAARMGFRAAYAEAAPTILEPVMRVEVRAPDEFQGAVIGQLAQRRGVVVATGPADGGVRVVAEVPLAEMLGYATPLRSATQGKGEFAMEPLRYAEVPKPVRDALLAGRAA